MAKNLVTKNSNVARIPSNLEKSRVFFRHWIEFLRPLHRLTSTEMDVVAAFLSARYELSKSIKDEELLDQVVMSNEIRKQIREELKITTSYFLVIMTSLRKCKVFVAGKLNRKYIPNIEEGSDEYRLILLFDFKTNPSNARGQDTTKNTQESI